MPCIGAKTFSGGRSKPNPERGVMGACEATGQPLVWGFRGKGWRASTLSSLHRFPLPPRLGEEGDGRFDKMTRMSSSGNDAQRHGESWLWNGRSVFVRLLLFFELSHCGVSGLVFLFLSSLMTTGHFPLALYNCGEGGFVFQPCISLPSGHGRPKETNNQRALLPTAPFPLNTHHFFNRTLNSILRFLHTLHTHPFEWPSLGIDVKR